MSDPVASVVITTRNRRDDTLRAVASALAQDCPVEVLVYDDLSDDGTAEAVRAAFPQARVFCSGRREGYIVNRNRGFRDAHSPVVVSIDDDAYLSAPDIVRKAVERLEAAADVAAVAIPYIEPLNRRSLSSLKSPFRAKAGEQLRSYVGCSHAIRRELALQAGGYREFFIHQGEERDLCIRLIGAGYKVVYGASAPIVHMVSPKRDAGRISWYGTRNQMFFEVFNVPFPEVLVRVPWTVQGILRYRFSWRDLPMRLAAVASGLWSAGLRIGERRALSRTGYHAYLRLSGHGPVEWDGEVPPPCHESAGA